jgi:hypothetical protein
MNAKGEIPKSQKSLEKGGFLYIVYWHRKGEKK